ncbi:MAG: hypothetical protein KDB68_02315 [Planctomycetes bacterium]|nr:hypothetical protein [Planctomycetota bacterium]
MDERLLTEATEGFRDAFTRMLPEASNVFDMFMKEWKDEERKPWAVLLGEFGQVFVEAFPQLNPNRARTFMQEIANLCDQTEEARTIICTGFIETVLHTTDDTPSKSKWVHENAVGTVGRFIREYDAWCFGED